METIKHILFIILVLVAVLFFIWLGWIGYNYFAPMVGLPQLELGKFLLLKWFVGG